MKKKVVQNSQAGLALAKKILYKEVNKKTLLFLSGGSQRNLYETIASEKKLKPFAIALVDERFGEKMHGNSNEKMIRETGLVADLEGRGVKFYPVLSGDNIQNTAKSYEKTIRELLAKSKKRIAILGIGSDGHTAGLPAQNQNSKLKNQKYVESINNFPGEFKERITLTFKALSQMDLLIILAFGSAKQNALIKMFEEGPIEEIPARFYTKPNIAGKTLLITDQKL